MQISTIINPPFKSNTYIIGNADTNNVIVIDPGGDEEHINNYLVANNLIPDIILLTHEHFDHITGVNNIKRTFTDCRIICTEECNRKIIDPKLNISFYANVPYTSIPADYCINADKYFFNWNGLTINCTPWEGHSMGGMLIEVENILFCGDQFIPGTKTVTNLPGGNKNKVKESFDYIKAKFLPETVIYPGHGAAFLLNDLLKY